MFTSISQVVTTYSSQQYTAFFATGETSAQVALPVFDDNVTEGGDNFTPVLNISEYSQFLPYSCVYNTLLVLGMLVVPCVPGAILRHGALSFPF